MLAGTDICMEWIHDHWQETRANRTDTDYSGGHTERD